MLAGFIIMEELICGVIWFALCFFAIWITRDKDTIEENRKRQFQEQVHELYKIGDVEDVILKEKR